MTSPKNIEKINSVIFKCLVTITTVNPKIFHLEQANIGFFFLLGKTMETVNQLSVIVVTVSFIFCQWTNQLIVSALKTPLQEGLQLN